MSLQTALERPVIIAHFMLSSYGFTLLAMDFIRLPDIERRTTASSTCQPATRAYPVNSNTPGAPPSAPCFCEGAAQMQRPQLALPFPGEFIIASVGYYITESIGANVMSVREEMQASIEAIEAQEVEA